MVDTKSSAKASPAKGSSSAKTPATTAPAAAGPSLGQRAMGFFLPTRGAQGQRRPQSSTSRFIMGSVIFILVAELITYLLDYLNAELKLNLNQSLAGSSASWLTPFFVINVVIILGLWIVLNKLGFFPRDLWNPRASSTARGAANNGASGSNGKSSAASNGSNGGNGKNNAANQIPGIGKARTRAERRYTATVAAAAATSAKSSKNSKQRVAAASATNATNATNAKASSADDDLSTEYDDAYDRARAAQRQRKRRALR